MRALGQVSGNGAARWSRITAAERRPVFDPLQSSGWRDVLTSCVSRLRSKDGGGGALRDAGGRLLRVTGLSGSTLVLTFNHAERELRWVALVEGPPTAPKRSELAEGIEQGLHTARMAMTLTPTLCVGGERE